MKSIDQFNFSGKKVLIRVDFNVPLNEKFEVTDETRLKAVLPTIKKVLSEGGSAILMSHLGRPKGGPEDKYSLRHVIKNAEALLGTSIQFANDCIGEEAVSKAAALKAGEVLLLENLRFYKEEEKGDVEFAKKLAALGNFYMNDAFGTAHRAHASTAVMAQFFSEKCAGYVMQAELVNADRIMKGGEKPVTAVMGGSKISDKIMVIENLIDMVDNLIIGGGMSYTFAKAMGGSVGKSLCEMDKLDLALSLMEKAKQKGVNLVLPVDTVIADDFSNKANTQIVKRGHIPEGWEGLDIGPETCQLFADVVLKSKTILWNGPMGVFEFENFAHGTVAIAKAVREATLNGAFSLIGGGDSASAINNLGFGNDVSYVSTGGGALLEYMEGQVLPGVAALD
jgi:phosphoglycerate kinase